MTSDATSAALPARLYGSVVPLSPTTVWRWHRCRRLYLLRNLVQLPPVDAGPWTEEGLRIHAVLHQLHRAGSCHDPDTVEDVVASYAAGDDERLRGYLQRHASRCPLGATYLGGEHPLGRLHRQPPPLFTVSGSIDAIWIHDGLLDARDYKTGQAPVGDLSEDVRARVQAWMLAPLAEERGLRLRVRYEYLAPETTEDPPPWDPEDERLASIEEELHQMVDEMRSERTFAGCATPEICGTCEYRSLCVDAVIERPAVS